MGETTQGLVATMGACLAEVGQATLVEPARASRSSIVEVRPALRRLSGRVGPTGMQILDDGNAVEPACVERLWIGGAAGERTAASPRLTPDQADALAIVMAPLTGPSE